MNKIFYYSGISLCALALMGWGCLQLYTGNFITGRPPQIIQNITSNGIIAGAVSFLFFIAVLETMGNKSSGYWFALNGFIILVIAFLNSIVLIYTSGYQLQLVNTNKSLSIAFGFLFIASLYNDGRHVKIDRIISFLGAHSKYIIGFFLLTSGIQHYIYPDFIAMLIPRWIPFPLFWSYFSGTALVMAGAALLTPYMNKIVALNAGIMIFVWLVILHIPRAMQRMNELNEWISVFEASFIAGYLFLLYFQLSAKGSSLSIKKNGGS